MKENTLMKFALIFSLIGLIALHFVAQKIEIKDYNPVMDKDIGEDVKFTGTIGKISGSDSVSFIDLQQQNQISVVFFGKNSILKEKDRIEVTGKIQSFNGKKEVIAEKIRVVK